MLKFQFSKTKSNYNKLDEFIKKRHNILCLKLFKLVNWLTSLITAKIDFGDLLEIISF